jgi:tripeptide aminopeptidase
MESYLDHIPEFVDKIKTIKESILTNVVLLGQIPAPTFQEQERTVSFLERLAASRVDECTTDSYGNPIGIIRGTSQEKPAIFVAAHMDTSFDMDQDHNYTVKKNSLAGAGILDNSLGVGVLVSLPEIIHHLELSFESDLVLAGVIQSIGRGNLRGVRHLLKTWKKPVRGAVCIEGGEIGRLNYYCNGMIRGEIFCSVPYVKHSMYSNQLNAILVLNDVMNQVLALRLPQRPISRIVFGQIEGGIKHGIQAIQAKLGFEIQSVSDRMVKSLFRDIQDIVDGVRHEYGVKLQLKTISNLNSSRISFQHPLVKSTVAIMKKLALKPVSQPSESELSIFLSHKIPAVTLGISRSSRTTQNFSSVEIEPIFKGIAQVLGVMMAIDNGVCDER